MPRRDGTGPMGMGSRTGMGFCNSAKKTGAIGGLRCRRGFGWSNYQNVMIDPKNQQDLLMQEKAILENRLNLVNNQLNTLQDDK